MEYKQIINNNLSIFTSKFKILKDIFEGGKRLRPIISILIYKNFSEQKNFDFKEEDKINLFLFSEILHNISLILDDLPCMDNDNYRRNKETIHYKYGKHSAILIIYHLLESYFEKIKNVLELNQTINIENKKVILEDYIFNIINDSCLELIEGQYLDLNFIPIGLNEKMIIKINSFKTVPLFRISFLIGYFILYKNDKNYIFKEEIINDLGNIAKSFGLISQISDDYLDIEQDKNNKIFLNFFLTLGKKRTIEIYNENFKNIELLLKKHNLYCKHFKEILTLINNRLNE